jgi:hypothetical protein
MEISLKKLYDGKGICATKNIIPSCNLNAVKT